MIAALDQGFGRPSLSGGHCRAGSGCARIASILLAGCVVPLALIRAGIAGYFAAGLVFMAVVLCLDLLAMRRQQNRLTGLPPWIAIRTRKPDD